MVIVEAKECSKCGEVKPAGDFYARKKGTVGLYSACKSCLNAAVTVDARRNRFLKSRYGITLDTYNEMLASQGGVCKVCKGPPMHRGTYHVDHDHETGKVRGLLCHKCNVALGMVGDSTALLMRLAEYVSLQGEL